MIVLSEASWHRRIECMLEKGIKHRAISKKKQNDKITQRGPAARDTVGPSFVWDGALNPFLYNELEYHLKTTSGYLIRFHL